MTAIPEDVRERAREAVLRVRGADLAADQECSPVPESATDIICALILSEREAARAEEREVCARIAEGDTTAPLAQCAYGSRFAVASAIREQKP